MKIETPVELANRLRGTLLSDADIKYVERICWLYPAAFVTGSALWCPDIAQDFDICVNAKQTDVALLLDVPANGEGSFGSLRLPDSSLNVVCLCVTRIAVWHTVTQLMSTLAPIRDKKKRVGVFEALCGLVSAADLCNKRGAVVGENVLPPDNATLGRALEVVHAMATRLYAQHGEICPPADTPHATQTALNVVEDFIVNNFEEE